MYPNVPYFIIFCLNLPNDFTCKGRVLPFKYMSLKHWENASPLLACKLSAFLAPWKLQNDTMLEMGISENVHYCPPRRKLEVDPPTPFAPSMLCCYQEYILPPPPLDDKHNESPLFFGFRREVSTCCTLGWKISCRLQI